MDMRYSAMRGTIGVREAALRFWAMRTVAAALGEIGGHAVAGKGSHFLAAAVVALIGALYARERSGRNAFWPVLVGVSTLSAALAHMADRSLGIGDVVPSVQLAALFALALIVWARVAGTAGLLAVGSIRDHAPFWIVAMLAQAFASSLADWVVDPGQTGSSIVLLAVAIGLPAVAAARWARIARPALFWAAFVLTGILGALWGDTLIRLINAGHALST
ncbi:hypothetical protein [Bradyrhizobium sp. Ce-3]|uniref:hypothetical protein n=1 Tax=Bradyrhizobium sp. Ce-3 TaxID=2913970 RepID=UPI001FC8E27E|nr:hypothetical protein [Bradyrhizobium sp. Ce-3]GKQ53436.1 membrane protein [Bradyrhizobium sp. Ce-3]